MNKAMDAFLGKAVGPANNEQALFLIYQLKRLLPNFKHVDVIAEDLPKLKDFCEISEMNKKRYRKGIYATFDKLVEKISGSSELEKQRMFLNARFQAVHSSKPEYKPLSEQPSWSKVKSMVNNLEQTEPTTFNDLTKRQMRRKGNKIKWAILKKLVEVVAGSEEQSHQETVIAKIMNELQPHTSPWKKLHLLVEKIEDLSAFKNDLTQNKLN